MNCFSALPQIRTYDYAEIHVMAKDNFAYCHFLCHIVFDFAAGHQLHGQKHIDNWLRSSLGLCLIKGEWKIIHEHVLAPIDMETGKGLMGLQP